MTLSQYKLIEIERLLSAMYPSRFERACSRLVEFAWRRNETGLWGFIGDQSDRLRSVSYRARARWRVRFKYRER